MSQTSIPFGHALARKVYGAAIFAEVVRKPGLTNRLTGPAPKEAEAAGKLEKMQTSSDYPFVRVTDLQRGAGDTVSVDLFNILEGLPTMGDRKLAGRMMSLTSSSQDIQINQIRGGVDTGGRMTRQRTVHDLRRIGHAGLAGWYARMNEQRKLIHAAGARGSQNTADWVIPLSTHAEYSDIMVNTVQAPTYNRHFYAGDATALTDLDTTDILTLDDLDRLRAAIDEANVPLQPVKFPDDPASDDEYLYVLLVSSRVWHFMQNRTGATAWRTFLQNARERGSSNPLFKGEPGMWNGILVKKMPRAIRFAQGEDVTTATSAASYTETTTTIGATQFSASNVTWHSVDRSILLGAQAVAEVYGRHSGSGTYFNWHEETSDHGNTMEASVAAMGGCQKLTFTDSNGEDFDHGVMVIDSYAPDPRYVTVA